MTREGNFFFQFFYIQKVGTQRRSGTLGKVHEGEISQGMQSWKAKSFKGFLRREIKIYGVVWILLWNASQPQTGYTNKLQKWQLFKGDQKQQQQKIQTINHPVFVCIHFLTFHALIRVGPPDSFQF